MNRRLTLKREALTDLTPRDLSAIAGAAAAASYRTRCTTDLLDESFLVCSLQCQWTANTCE